MIDFRFILNPGGDAMEIEEPIGWADIAIEVVRDAKYHGISIAYGLSDLQFTGEAAWFLQEQYEAYGIDAAVEIQIFAICDGRDQYGETFRLDFGQYEQDMGGSCSVKIGIEQASCFVKFAAGMDKKVDLETATTFGGLAVPDLPLLKQEITLPSQTMLKSAEGYVTAGSEPVEALDHVELQTIRPVFFDTKFESLKTTQLKDPALTYGLGHEVVSPILLYEDDTRCFSGKFNVSMRMKGSLSIQPFASGMKVWKTHVVFLKGRETYFPYNADNVSFGTAQTLGIQTLISNYVAVTGSEVFNFDLSYTNPELQLAEGESIWGFIYIQADVNTFVKGVATFHPETFVKIEAMVNCPPTDAHVFLPFETIQRVADVITDGCLRVESTWYGRTEHGNGRDGCGAFRAIAGGLYLRGAPSPKVFLSMKELFDGLQPVDGIGFALEKDEEGDEVMLVEPIDYFYSNFEILRLDNLPGVKLKAVPNDIPGIIKVGYEKWKTEKVNGLYEFNSTREYRSSVTAASATFEIISKFIAAGTIIEVARQETFAQTGAADTAYDDDIFLIQLKRVDAGLEVEQGVPSLPSEMIDPPSVINFRLTPARNLLRWWRWLSGMAFRDIETGAFRFSAGTGNYRAEGLINDECTPEAFLLGESEDIVATLLDSDYHQALARAESVTFETTMSLADFKMLRANPYGYVSYQCGTGEWRKGYITKVTYHIARSTAAFELRSKYE